MLTQHNIHTTNNLRPTDLNIQPRARMRGKKKQEGERERERKGKYGPRLQLAIHSRNNYPLLGTPFYSLHISNFPVPPATFLAVEPVRKKNID